MPKIVSLNSNNQVKYPATITDAVIDLNSGKPLSELLNGVDYSKQYLTFTILQEGTVVFLGNSTGVACCSLDGGRTWSEYGGTVTVQAEVGDVILWKAIPLYFEYSGIGSFSTSTASFNLSGNITSLVYGDNFITSGDTLPQSTGYACAYLFSNTNVISAKNLVLPSTTINTMCYYLLFLDCSSLVEAPEVLPATTLVGGCYKLMFKNCVSLEKAPKILGTNLEYGCCEDMFLNCGKLNFIEAHFLTAPSTTSNKDWVAGVAPTGTFVKDPAATWNVVGNYAIPTGWVSLNENQNLTVSKDDVILSRTYNNILRANNSYSSPYATSYLYFGQVKPIDITRGSMVRYRILAFVPGNTNYYLDSIVEWYFTTNGIYSSYYIWNNLKSTSYYPFGYHTLYRSNSTAISLSDGSYIGCYYGTSTSYGLSPNTIARTFLVDVLRCENCEVSLLDDIRWLTDTANLPANFKLTSTSVAYNTTNFTAVNVSTGAGLQETGDANSDTVGYSIRTNSYSKPMKSALGYGYRLLFTSADLLGWVPANNSTSSNATAVRTPATDPIDPFGEIVYYSGTGAVAAGSRPSVTALWELYTITLGYSFNTTGAALTLTSWLPVYVKCTPLVNGSAVIEGYTLNLPTEEDGFIYIYLGVAYSATAVELVIKHPVYYFKNGAIRLWTGNDTTEEQYYSTLPLTLDIKSDGTIQFSKAVGGMSSSGTAQYSLDGGNTWSEDTNSVTLNVTTGDKIQWKGTLYTTFGGICTFEGSTADFDVYGNISSVMDTGINKEYNKAASMFKNTNCINAKNLILYTDYTTELGKYSNLFYGCTKLISVPDISKVPMTSSCFSNMFYGCTSLKEGPKLTATTFANGCYFGMFGNTNLLPDCTNIDFTSQTVVGSGVLLGLFAYTKVTDTDLRKILPINPATGNYWLPVMTLSSGCYRQMFSNCTLLTTAPDLPATTLVSQCYNYMFEKCSSLNFVRALFTTTPSTSYTSSWLSNVSATGTFVKNSSATWNVSGVNGVPSGWNVYTESEYEVVRHYELNDFIVTATLLNSVITSDKTISEIIEAKEAGKNVWLDASSIYQGESKYPLNIASDIYGGFATFTKVSWAYGNSWATVATFILTGTTLTHSNYTIENTSNKVTSLSSSSTDTQYPSAKLVYDTTSVLAPKASPALTGTPTAPTAAAGTNTTQIATTAFVKNAVDSKTHYVANLQAGTAANYITEPEFKSVKVNGSTTNSASSSNCVLQYDTTNKCLKFIFN